MSDVEFMSESQERRAPLRLSESLFRGAQNCSAYVLFVAQIMNLMELRARVRAARLTH